MTNYEYCSTDKNDNNYKTVYSSIDENDLLDSQRQFLASLKSA